MTFTADAEAARERSRTREPQVARAENRRQGEERRTGHRDQGSALAWNQPDAQHGEHQGSTADRDGDRDDFVEAAPLVPPAVQRAENVGHGQHQDDYQRNAQQGVGL